MTELTNFDFYNQTTLHPVGIIAMLVLGVATLLVPRRFALIPMLMLACFVPSAQRIVVASLDFNFLRVVIAFGWLRVLMRSETSGFRWNTLDTLVTCWALCGGIVATLLYLTTTVLVYRLGLLYDAVGIYFLCRVLIRGWGEMRIFAQSAALISVPVLIFFLIEKSTGRNMFAAFGGVPEYTLTREGRLRCQGPFSHPILAGAFWAALLPLIGALWFERRWNRWCATIGLLAAGAIVVVCASATPINGVIFGLGAVALFPLRRFMGLIRAAAVLGLIMLQLAMINPIWHLMARMDIVAGATGWYRFKLIDEFVRNFDEWWLAGTTTYAEWWYIGLDDLTNEYVQQGVNGGLATLVLFAATIIVAFRGVGRMLRGLERPRVVTTDVIGADDAPARRVARQRPNAGRIAMAWALGVSLFIQCVVFTGVSYFGQTILVWFLALGFIGSLAPAARRRAVRRTRVRAVPERPPASAPDEALALN